VSKTRVGLVAAVALLLAGALLTGVVARRGERPGDRMNLTGANWDVRAGTTRERFALGEPILILVSARSISQGALRRPALDSGAEGETRLWVARDGGPSQPVALPGPGEVPPRDDPPVLPGETASGWIDLGSIFPIVAGTYEVSVDLGEGSRSAPVRFVVERARVLASATAPLDPTAVGRRAFAHSQPREGGPHLILTRTRLKEPETFDLGLVREDAKLAVSVPAFEAVDGREWVAVVSSRSLERVFVDAEPCVHRFPPIDLPADATVLLAALGGEPVAPAPPPRPPIEPDGRVHAADPEPWPTLHLLLASRPQRGPAQLFGIAIAPSVSAVPAVATRDLPGALLAGAAVPLTATNRLALAAVPEKAGLELLGLSWNALSWSPAGFGAPFRILGSPGRLVALDAVALGDTPGARTAVLVFERREKEKDDALFLREARVDPSGIVQELPPRLVASGERSKTLSNLRVRLSGARGVFVLGTRTADRRNVLVQDEGEEPWPVNVPVGVPWDLEVRPNGALVALFVDPERGVSSETIEPPGPR
jgi:hypothetical protein